jgi:GTP cyclohydrolase II
MTDAEILIWIHQRLVKVHGENPHTDYMHRFREAIGWSLDSSVQLGNDYSSAVLEYIYKLEKTHGNTN